MKKSRARKAAPRRRPPTISLCVIARDEEDYIGDCLASARDFVDEILVLDTGSTDRTAEIARTFTARIESFVWQDDFAAARNTAIDLATSDWVLMLDADERLQPSSGPALRAFVDSRPAGPMFYAPRIDNWTSETDFQISFPNRLFPRTPQVRYIGTIHEDLTYLPDPARAHGMRLDNVRITHLGYLPEIVKARNKFERNRRLLLLATTTGPDDPQPWYYLGMDRVTADEPGEAAEYFRQSLSRVSNRPNWTSAVEIYTQLVWAYIQLKDAVRLASIVGEAELAGKLSASARGVLAQDLVVRGLYAAAAEQLRAALGSNQPVVQVIQPGVGGWLTRLDLARVYELMGSADAALHQLELVLADPDVRDRGEVATTAVRLAVQVGDMDSLSRCLEAMTPPGEADLEGTLRLLELRAAASPLASSLRLLSPTDRAVSRGDWQAAAEAALGLSGHTRADAARLLFVAGRLEGTGEPGAALRLLEHLYDAQPELPQLHWVLSKVLADLGRYEDALAANEILQRLLAAQARQAAA